MLVNENDFSRDQTREQSTKSSTLRDSDPCSCGRSDRLNHEPALWWLVPLTTGDLNGQCSDRSPSNSYPTDVGAGELARPAPAAAARIPRRWSSFSLASKVKRSDSLLFPPRQVLIFTSFYADVSLCEFGPPAVFFFYLYKNLWRLCPTFTDRLFSFVFSRSHDRSSSVGQKSFECSTSNPCGLVAEMSQKLPGKEVKGVPGRFGNLVSMPARGCAGSLPLYSRITVSEARDGDV